MADLEATLASEHVVPEVGDIWCVRTGWVGAYRQLDADGRVAYARDPTFAGLHAGEDMARYVWNAHPAALCCDNPAVEVVPGDPAVGRSTGGCRRRAGLVRCSTSKRWPCNAAEERWTFFFVAARLVPGRWSLGNLSPSGDAGVTYRPRHRRHWADGPVRRRA